MLAGVQGGQRDRAVQVGPGADDDGVEVRIGDQVLPVLEDLRDAVLSGDGLGRGRPPVADGDDVHVREGPEAWDVTGPRVGPRANQSDAEMLRHDGVLGEDVAGVLLLHEAAQAPCTIKIAFCGFSKEGRSTAARGREYYPGK